MPDVALADIAAAVERLRDAVAARYAQFIDVAEVRRVCAGWADPRAAAYIGIVVVLLVAAAAYRAGVRKRRRRSKRLRERLVGHYLEPRGARDW